MNALRYFSANHPVLFVLAVTAAWLVLLLVLMGAASSAFRKPYNDAVPAAVGRLAVAAVTLLLMWRLGWLDASGVTRLGGWQVWLLAAGGLLYYAAASLYAFYGRAALDVSTLARLPASRPALLAAFTAGFSEELLFRGLVLYALVRAWGNTSPEVIGSAALAALLFAVLHASQVFTHGVSPSSAALLVLQAGMVAFWWGALVLSGGSLWPAVLLHAAGNAVLALQGLAVGPSVEIGPPAYLRLFWLSVPLFLLGAGLLARALPHAAAPAVP